MSGWIKWEKDLESDPRVLRMAKELKRTCNAGALHPVTLVCGGLVRLWSYADSHARADDTLDLGPSEIDDLIGIPNFCSIIPADWLRQVDDHTVELPNFQAHNGIEARKRALTQKRVETHRKRSSVTPALTTALPDQDLDQTKTNKKTPSVSGARKRAAPPRKRCPDDFDPPEPERAKIRAECPDVDLVTEERKFRDHEFARGRSDWLATWRNWMREAQTRAALRPKPAQPAKRRPPTDEEIAAERRKAAEANRRELAAKVGVLAAMPR